MSTFVVVGAGPGLGLAAARRFAREGFGVGLVGRSPERVEALADRLRDEGTTAAAAVADVRDPAALVAALDDLAVHLGPVDVLQFSPAPAPEFMKPVLDTTADDLVGPWEFAVRAPVTVVRHLLAGLRERRGSVLFVGGGSAMIPRSAVAGTSIAYAAESAYARMLHDALRADGVHVGQLVVPGAIVEGDPVKDPAVLADLLWSMHRDRDGFRRVVGDPA